MMSLWNDMTGWQIFTYLYYGINIVTYVIFTIVTIIGGAFDLRHMIRELLKDSDEIQG